MDDLISRQAAIDAIKSRKTAEQSSAGIMMNAVVDFCIDIVKKLPSAQPDLDEWCTDCSEYDQERHCCPRWNRVIRQTLKDAQPTADVRENVKGRWVEVVDRTEMYDKEGVKTWGMLFQCNQCGFVLNAVESHTGQYNYCPNCGADMRGEQDDESRSNSNAQTDTRARGMGATDKSSGI